MCSGRVTSSKSMGANAAVRSGFALPSVGGSSSSLDSLSKLLGVNKSIFLRLSMGMGDNMWVWAAGLFSVLDLYDSTSTRSIERRRNRECSIEMLKSICSRAAGVSKSALLMTSSRSSPSAEATSSLASGVPAEMPGILSAGGLNGELALAAGVGASSSAWFRVLPALSEITIRGESTGRGGTKEFVEATPVGREDAHSVCSKVGVGSELPVRTSGSTEMSEGRTGSPPDESEPKE